MEERSLHTPEHRAATVWDGAELLATLRAAAHWLEQHVDSINALNVFPVPDGDTGTNMSLTLNGALDGVEPEPSCAAVADKVKYWATMRGRGNSGIILSQVLRGLALGIAGHETMDGAVLAEALTQASATAYKAVMKPVEGTMLTVIRETAEAAQAAAAGGATLPEVLTAAARGADASVERTPTLLKTLRDAGVVDSGGRGLAVIFEGMRRHVFGESEELTETGVVSAPAMAFEDIHGPDDFGYCTNFVLQGSGMPFEEIRATLAEMGESAAIVGDGDLIKAHIHLLRPGDALNYAVGFGSLTQIEITNMDLQREALHAKAEAPAEQLAESEVGVVAVAPGDGFAAIFRSLNVGAVITGGQTMNPSTEDLLAAIQQLPQAAVIVLPNNGNILMAARQAAQISDKQVEVVPSRTVPQGIAAMLSFNYQANSAANVRAMTGAMAGVRTAEITRAARDANVDGLAVRAGQTIGLIDGDLVAAADAADALIDDLLTRLDLDNREIVSVYYGQDVQPSDAAALAERIQERFPGLEAVEVQQGGQPLYDYILAAE